MIAGVSDYASSPLNFCDEDASDWYNYLNGLGYEITLLGHANAADYPKHDGLATKEEVSKAIRAMVAKADGDDLITVVFSGHGVKQGNTSCYLTAEMDYYCAGALIYDLNTGDFGRFFSFYDICNSGAFGSELKAAGFGKDIYATTTCTIDGYGYDGNGNGQWTAVFLNQGLTGQFGGQNKEMGEAFQWAHGTYYPSMAWSGAIDEPLEFDGDPSSGYYLDHPFPEGRETSSAKAFSDPERAAENGVLADELTGFASAEVQHNDWSPARVKGQQARRAPLLSAAEVTDIHELVNVEQGFQNQAARCLFSYSIDYLDADGTRIGQLGLCHSDGLRRDHEAVYIPFDENGKAGLRRGLIIPDAEGFASALEAELSR